MRRCAMMWALCGLWMTGLGLGGCDDDGDTAAAPDARGESIDGSAELPDGSLDDMQTADAGPDGGGEDPVAAAIGAVDLTRYATDLEAVSSGPRHWPDGSNREATQERCVETFLAAGLEVVRQPVFGGGLNIIGTLPGTERPAEQILVGAHYDSEFECAGADDNASGVAAVLEAARVLGARRYARTLVFICFDVEENSKRGSTDYARRAEARGDDIRGAFIPEMVGYTDARPGSQQVPEGLSLAFPALGEALAARDFRGDFLLYVADDDPEMVGHLGPAADAVGLPLIGLQLAGPLRVSAQLADLRRSDHAPLWDYGFPAMMLTDTANFRNPYYHCAFGEDDIDTLDLDFALASTQAVIGAVTAAAGPTAGEPTAGREREPDPLLGPEDGPPCTPDGGGCAAGQRCALTYDPLEVRCVAPHPEPQPFDAPCTILDDGTDDCAAGLFCNRLGSSDGERRCRTLCETSADCVEGEGCVDFGLDLSLCQRRCDPIANDCLEGFTCVYNGDPLRDGYVTHCLEAGERQEGEPCSTGDACVAGLDCSFYSTTHDLGCTAWCSLSAPDCGPGRVCRSPHRRGVPADAGFCVPEERVLD